MENLAWIQDIPKVELHCHLDGSLSPEALREIARQSGRPLPAGDELHRAIAVKKKCKSLAEYLQCFDFVLVFLQDEFALELAGYDVIRQAAEDNVLYIEVRFAPLLFCAGGLKPHQAVEAVLRGIARGQDEFGVQAGAILCMMRHMSQEANANVLEMAKDYLGQGVCGLDLAGDEAAIPLEAFAGLFKQASRLSIPYTIHAGECGSAANVRLAVGLGATRIGHGIAAACDPETLRLCAEKGVLLEVCPTSNLQTGAVQGWASHPLPQLCDAGIRLCLNTDNRTVSHITLREEYEAAYKNFGKTSHAQLAGFNQQALQAAFLGEDEKRLMLKTWQVQNREAREL